MIRKVTSICMTMCLAACLIAPAAVSGQVWVLPKQAWNVGVSFSDLQYDEGFDDDGEVADLPVDIIDRTIQLSAQYGITDALTAELRVPYKLIETSGDPGVYNSVPGQYIELGSLQALGNIEAGVSYNFYKDKPILTGSVFVEAPTSERNYITAIQTGFNSWAIRPGIGAGWTHGPSWMQFYMGTSLRNNNYSHAVISELELGYKPVDYLYAAMLFNMRQSFGNGEDCDCSTQATALYLSEQEYIGLALKGGVMFEHLGINFAYHSALGAKNVAAAGVPVIGFQFRSN